MISYLLDANVLIALTVSEHEQHGVASAWFTGIDAFAVCPVVEGALIRFLTRIGERADTAQAVLSGVRRHGRCQFWPDSVSYLDTDLSAVRGHRQVTDTYLVSLAASRDAKLATLDAALAQTHPHVSHLVS